MSASFATPLRPAPAIGLTAVLLLAASGCQGASSPATPPTSSANMDQPLLVAPNVDLMTSGDLHAGLATLGLYDFAYDTRSGEFSLTPARAAAALGDAFTLDLTDAFTTRTFGCASCLSVTGISRIPGPEPLLAVNFTAKHPFADTLSAGRADLHINNIRLVFLEDGSESFYGDPNNAAVAGNIDLLANANGYTALPATFVTPPSGVNASLFPFRVFETGDPLAQPTGNFSAVTGWTGVLNDPSGYNVFKMGGSATTEAQFRLSGSSLLQGRIALLGNYIVSAANKNQRPTPDYYMPEGAMPEAWKVMVTPPATFTADPVAQFDVVTVEVADWQHGGAVDASFPGADRNGLKASGDVASVQVSIPAFSANAFGPVTTPTSGTGTLASPLSYEVTVSKPGTYTTPGEVLGLVKVTDSRTTYLAIDKTLNAGTGLSQLAEVATYQVFRFTLDAPNTPPTCEGYTVNGNLPSPTPLVIPTGFNASLSVALNFSFTNDTDGTITGVDVDWSYDGSNFNVEATRTDAGSLTSPTGYTAPDTIGIRFTDDDGAQTVCTVAIGNVYTPTTTLNPATIYLAQSQTTNNVANGNDMNLGRIEKQFDSYGNTVYALLKADTTATTGLVYLARSLDGGTTWNLTDSVQIGSGLAAGLGNRFATVTMTVNADGSAVYIAGIGSPTTGSSGNVVFSRVNTATWTLDASIRGVQVENASTAFDPLFNGFETAIAAHPTNPEVVYICSDDETPARKLRIVQISNAKTAASPAGLTFSRVGGGDGFAYATDGAQYNSFFDPHLFMETNGTGSLHIVGQAGGGTVTTGAIAYREYDLASNTFVGAGAVLMTDFTAVGTHNNREPRVAVGTDGRPVLVIRSDGASGQDRAMIRKAALSNPPYNFSAAKTVDPDWDTATTANQEKPELEIDPATGLIYVTTTDTRDIGLGESNSSAPSSWETVFDTELNVLIDGRKLDFAGIGDNGDGDRITRPLLTLKGSPTTKRWIYFWQDASRKNTANPDIKIRIAQ